MLKLTVSLSILLLLISCLDLRKPWYGYYRWSGERAKDKRIYFAAQGICWELMEPTFIETKNKCENNKQTWTNECNSKPSQDQAACNREIDSKVSACYGYFTSGNRYFVNLECADGMASLFKVPPGEFRPLSSR